MMKRHEPLPKIAIKPDLPARKKLKDQYETVKEYARHYDKVIWLLDFDTVLKESRETRKGQKTKIQEFKAYGKALEKHKNVEVLINTPCLEFWFLLHFHATGRYFTKCENAVEALKKLAPLKDYEKTERYYKKPHNDIYKKLKTQQQTARVNAEKLGAFNFENPESAKAGIYRIFELL